MRITQLQQATLLGASPKWPELRSSPLEFTCRRGERFTISVLEQDLIRVQHLPDGRSRLNRTWTVLGGERASGFEQGDVPREGRLRDDLSPFSCPTYELSQQENGLQLRTADLLLEIDPSELCLRWSSRDGRLFAADLPGRAYVYDKAGQAVFHYLQRFPNEHYYGFGERAGPLDKAGMRMRLVNLDALGYDAQKGDPLYKHFPFYICFNPDLDLAYGLYYDNLAVSTFDMGQEVDNYYPAYRYWQADGGDVDYYLIYGPSIPEVVRKFSALTGRMALPPRWSLGYLGSTMTYTEAPDAQEQLMQFIKLCQEHHIPCDMFHLSSGYGTSDEGKRYVFTWNLKKIPDPKGLVQAFHQAGIRLAANIKPALLTTHPRYDEVAEMGGFILAAEADEPELSVFWGGLGGHVDFTNPASYAWWKQRVLDRLLNFGIDGTWNDNNEYPIWDDEARCCGFGEAVPIRLVRPLHSLLMNRASREAQLEFQPAERPYLLSRSGCPGIQRYAQTWSGDNHTSWNTLRYNIPMGLGLSLSSAPNTGHDIGGFAGPKPDPELFVRWVQNGIFHPRFTIHSWNEDGTVNEPWMYPEVLPIIRESIEFRYRLIPYLYSLVFEAARSGQPIIRPLVYDYAGDPATHTESFDFLLGPNLLVASVLEPGARQRDVYLPRGTNWCDFYSGAWYTGGSTVTLPAPLERNPLLVPAGGMIPMGRLMRHFGEAADDTRQVLVYPGPAGSSGRFHLIEDDGISHAYREGGYSEIELNVSAGASAIDVGASLVRNGYPLPYQEIEFILPPGESRELQIRGKHAAWMDEQARLHVSLPVGEL